MFCLTKAGATQSLGFQGQTLAGQLQSLVHTTILSGAAASRMDIKHSSRKRAGHQRIVTLLRVSREAEWEWTLVTDSHRVRHL